MFNSGRMWMITLDTKNRKTLEEIRMSETN